jgi:hypothetical protein
VQTGNPALSAPTTVTLGGLTNGSSISLYGGSSTDAVTLTVAGPADNSDTLNIGNYSTFDVTDGNIFTQTGGTTTVQGTLTAATIDIDGGVLAVDTTNFTNIGTITAADGGKIDLSASGLTNLSGTTLTGGTYVVGAGSQLQLPDDQTIVILAANLTLSGTGPVVQSLDAATSGQVAIESSLTTIAADGAPNVVGGRPYTTANALADSGSLTVGGGTFTAASLSVADGGTLVIDAGATLSLGSPLAVTETATNAGTINGGSATAVMMASGTGRLILDPGFAFDGTVVGRGDGSVLELAPGSVRGILNALGTEFTDFDTVTVDSGAAWTVDALASALSGVTITGSGGSNTLDLTTAGTVDLSEVSGFPTITLASTGANSLTLTNANFIGVTGSSITVNGGNDGNTVNASGLTAPNTSSCSAAPAPTTSPAGRATTTSTSQW